MTDCCLYFLAQAKINGIWIDLPFSSKALDEVNTGLTLWKKNHLGVETRVLQRKIAEDRAVGRKVPNCC